ncbi:hypothetical protein Zm00014a_003999 [Zea mays]|uniref:Uncharacterized protein n=1 Tax=Zea mays TaxID=4577 RepID=A0A3L6D7I7_MAIZE|nr:hypothetical protein Zm00014a_003999 [Zea mays]
MGKSLARWIKFVLFGKKSSSRSSSTKANNLSIRMLLRFQVWLKICISSYGDDFGFKLKEEAMLNRVLKETILSKVVAIEQLQSDLASSFRIQDVMRNEIQRVQNELSCITHKAKQLELQNEVVSLKKKIEALDEDILVKEGQITILQDSIDKPFNIICSPSSMQEFDMA